jgi:murein lipoprotein
MSSTKLHLTTARTLGVVIAATLSLAACATKDDIAGINSRLDQLDSNVQSAAQSAQSANESAQRANQRLDQMEGRIQQLESRPARAPRG